MKALDQSTAILAASSMKNASKRLAAPLSRIARLLMACGFTCLCLYCLALSHYREHRSEIVSSLSDQLKPQAREPYSIAYVKWAQAIMETNPAIVSIYRYQPEVPNHIALIVPNGSESPLAARAQAKYWYSAFRDWRRKQPETRIDLSMRRSPAQCVAEIYDTSGDELAWANQLGVRN